MRAIIIAMVSGLIAGIILGLAAYHHLIRWEPHQTTTATFKPGHVQADGSADLTRIPTAPKDAGPPPHMLPPKARETERARIVVKPKPRPAGNVPPGQHGDTGSGGASVPGHMEPTCSCEPVVVDISRYLGPDGAGVIASSPDGEVDVSRSTYTPMLEERPAPRHFAHLTADTGDGYTAAIGKRWGRVGLSFGASKQAGDEARPMIGVELNW